MIPFNFYERTFSITIPVISALREPIPGWIDNWNGSTGIFVGMSSGVMKVMTGEGSNVTDLVPLDIVTNLIIVAATKCERY